MEGGREGNKGRGREEEDRGRRKEGGRGNRRFELASWAASLVPGHVGAGPSGHGCSSGRWASPRGESMINGCEMRR